MVQFKDDSLNDKQLCGYFCCALSSSFSFGKTVVELRSSVIKKLSLHAHQLLKTIPSFHKNSLLLDPSTSVVLLVLLLKRLGTSYLLEQTGVVSAAVSSAAPVCTSGKSGPRHTRIRKLRLQKGFFVLQE